MKKKIYIGCCIANFVLIGYLSILVLMIFCGNEWAARFFTSQFSNVIMSILAYPTVILFVKNNLICYKLDTANYGIRLLLFNVLYNPFYFIRVIKNNWI
jgi:hypothetical protein